MTDEKKETQRWRIEIAFEMPAELEYDAERLCQSILTMISDSDLPEAAQCTRIEASKDTY